MDPLERIRLELNDALELLEEEDNVTAAEHIRYVIEILDELSQPCLGEPVNLDTERRKADDEAVFEEDDEGHYEPSYLMHWDKD